MNMARRTTKMEDARRGSHLAIKEGERADERPPLEGERADERPPLEGLLMVAD